MNLLFRIAVIFLFSINVAFGNIKNTSINIKVNTDIETINLILYKPFSEYSNNDFPEIYSFNKDSTFKIDFFISKTTFLKFIINETPIWIIIEPKECINVNINLESEIENSNDWIEIDGKNRAGNIYFNCFYNYQPSNKYLPLRDKFENNLSLDNDIFLKTMFNSIDESYSWVNTLFEKKQISHDFKNLMTTEISFSLAKELCIGLRKFFHEDNQKQNYLLEKVMLKFNPFEETLKRTLYAKNYTSNYLENLDVLNLGQTIFKIEEVKHNDLAPINWQNYLWANSIAVYMRFQPANYDYSDILKNYENKFGKSELYEAMTLLLSSKTNSSNEKEITFLENQNHKDFFRFLSENFPNKNLYIDLWATWCGPCKKEFQFYTDIFYENLKNQNIQPLFLSFDEDTKDDLWKSEVRKLNLKGIHVRVSKKLYESIKEIIYDNGTISIPRYLLVKKGGSIANMNAPKPSLISSKEDLFKF